MWSTFVNMFLDNFESLCLQLKTLGQKVHKLAALCENMSDSYCHAVDNITLVETKSKWHAAANNIDLSSFCHEVFSFVLIMLIALQNNTPGWLGYWMNSDTDYIINCKCLCLSLNIEWLW